MLSLLLRGNKWKRFYRIFAYLIDIKTLQSQNCILLLYEWVPHHVFLPWQWLPFLSLPLNCVFLARKWSYTSENRISFLRASFQSADYQGAHDPQWRVYGKDEKRMLSRRMHKFETDVLKESKFFFAVTSPVIIHCCFRGRESVSCKKRGL